MHIDPVETSAWNLMVEGRKRWVLLPPSARHIPGLEWREEDGAMVAMGAALWFRTAAKEKKMRGALRLRGAVEVVQGPGELLFVPNGWWHTVINLETTVAYTENYVSMENLDAVVGALCALGDAAVADRLLEDAAPRRAELVRPEPAFGIKLIPL